MAAHSVVISTNAGGLSEINVQGETGFMANVGDVMAMGQFAVSLLKEEDRLNRMKEAAYQHALQFDIHQIIPVYETLYGRFCRMDSGEKS
jgi:glycosyltransferase involved in cell wall biosynthesis